MKCYICNNNMTLFDTKYEKNNETINIYKCEECGHVTYCKEQNTQKTIEKKYTYNGVGFPSLLTLLFIGLKLAGCIHWSWLWVLSPLWITVALIIMLIVILFLL